MMIPLVNVADVSTGYPFRKKVESEEGGDVPLVQIKDIDGAEGDSGSGTVMLRNDDRRYERYMLHAGDLLFQSRGTRHPVAVVKAGVRGIAATSLHTIRPDQSQVKPEYLAWWLNHPKSQAAFRNDLARGTYIPFVAKSDLEQFSVPLPSIEVQRQIVELNQLRRQEQQLRARLDALTQQVVDGISLTAATRGR